jgi:TRAP-type transport system small permease protein
MLARQMDQASLASGKVGIMKKIFYIMDKSMDYFVSFLMFLLVIIGGTQVLCRYAFNYSLTWSEELSKYMLVWLVFLAMGIGLRRQAHLGMNVVVMKFSMGVQKIFGLFTCLLSMIFGGVIVYFTSQLIQVAAFQTTPALEISMAVIYYGMLFGGLYTFIVGLRFLIAGFLNHKQTQGLKI